MTTQEIAVVVAEVRRDRAHEFAPDLDADHDRWGNARDRDHTFDARHIEDVFPY